MFVLCAVDQMKVRQLTDSSLVWSPANALLVNTGNLNPIRVAQTAQDGTSICGKARRLAASAGTVAGAWRSFDWRLWGGEGMKLPACHKMTPSELKACVLLNKLSETDWLEGFPTKSA